MIPVWALFGILWMVGFYQPGRNLDNPEWKGDGVVCRDLTDLEMKSKGYVPEGKAAPYGISGESICEKNIFRYGERQSFAEFVIRNAPQSSRIVAHNLIEIYSRENRTADHQSRLPIYIDVSNIEDASIRHYLRSLYLEAVALNLGSGAAIRVIDPKASYRILRIGLRKVIDPNTLFVIELSSAVEPGSEKRTWVML
jgi:hypothetical protein